MVEERREVIRTDCVSFSYQEGTMALARASMQVSAGEFIALLASNGSGKTTLLEILAGLLKPQKGQVFINGKNIRSFSSPELYQQIGIVLQNPGDQLFASTVRDDVAFGPHNLGLSQAEVDTRVDEALSSVGAEHLAARAIHQLSFGEQKRVCVAGVLAMRPAIMKNC